MVERFNRTIEHQLAIFVNENRKDWDEHIPLLLMAYRTATHESTGLTPAKVMMGRELRVPLDLLIGIPSKKNYVKTLSYVEKLEEGMDITHSFARKRLKITTDRMKTRYNINAMAVTLSVGTPVWLYRPQLKKGLSPKLSKPWVGPYVILKRINGLVYGIELSSGSKPMVVHRNRLREYVGENVPQVLSREEGVEVRQEKEPAALRRSTRERRTPVRLEI
ncbi:Retrovirus-related Pol poly from transposon 412 [Paramuricea clavata]|uniref:Retrovirus-related Pol poly from transposon 412 n=1 Tax=Paramuricea clavata TaxID=317549 RepID=A0A6S7IFM3_PARCT|nr:Retrovirus-related Pol poly from transposon 412 [Paramuricea clavata]